MTNKMTKKDYFNAIANIIATAEISTETRAQMLGFIDHEVELLSKKSSGASSAKKEAEQGAVMDEILEALNQVNKAVTISELQKEVPRMAEYSNQKLSAMLRKLAEAGRVTKVIEKKKSYFSIAPYEFEEEEV